MFRIGRDKKIINFEKKLNDDNNIFIICYGEVDCRCHIGKQINMGNSIETVIKSLVDSFIETIKKEITNYKKIIICAVIPPMCREKYENVYGPITHEFPFINSNEDRAIYTQKLNSYLKNKSDENGFIFFDPYHY